MPRNKQRTPIRYAKVRRISQSWLAHLGWTAIWFGGA
jgi:hypothetical protein